MFETQSKERVLSSDQLSKSIYSSFFVDVVVIITVDTMLTYRQRERERVQRRKKPAKSRGKRQRKQGRDKKKCNFPSSMWNDQCSEGKRERERAWSDREFRSQRTRSRWNTRACTQREILIKYFHVSCILSGSFFFNLSIDASFFFFFFSSSSSSSSSFLFRVQCISSRTMRMAEKRATSNARRD